MYVSNHREDLINLSFFICRCYIFLLLHISCGVSFQGKQNQIFSPKNDQAQRTLWFQSGNLFKSVSVYNHLNIKYCIANLKNHISTTTNFDEFWIQNVCTDFPSIIIINARLSLYQFEFIFYPLEKLKNLFSS